jgi:gamma-glutamylcyclotransferase (GGCT)/AIG2-like uncharacterized protein YtfP
MRPRCGAAREIGTGVLEGYRFMITTDGYASVLPARGGIVHGLVWRLTPRDLAALDAYESLDTGLYRAVTLPVRRGGTHAPALVYVGRSRVPGRPRPGYLEEVLAAARDLGFPAPYRRSLARWARSAREAVA